jgi:hypothetical protein
LTIGSRTKPAGSRTQSTGTHLSVVRSRAAVSACRPPADRGGREGLTPCCPDQSRRMRRACESMRPRLRQEEVGSQNRSARGRDRATETSLACRVGTSLLSMGYVTRGERGLAAISLTVNFMSTVPTDCVTRQGLRRFEGELPARRYTEQHTRRSVTRVERTQSVLHCIHAPT